MFIHQAFPGDPKLQRQACWALLTLAANDEISRMIASEGGVGAIIAAMINNAGWGVAKRIKKY